MIIDNLYELLAILRSLGFGNLLDEAGHFNNISDLPPGDFTINIEDDFDGQSCMKTLLHFRRFKSSDEYAFEKFTSTLIKSRDEPIVRWQTFPVIPKGVTHREAYNLLSGRSVNKDIISPDDDLYNAWIRLDFDHILPDGNYKIIEYRPMYGFEIERLLQQFPIEELKVESLRKNIIFSLKKGNQHPVTFLLSKKKEKKLIEACPERKCIIIRNPKNIQHA